MSSEPPVFISHSHVDVERARALKAELGRLGIVSWLAPDDMTGAAVWAQQLFDVLIASRAVVVLVSAATLESEHVLREVTLAADQRKPVVPVRLEAIATPGPLGYMLSVHQFIEAAAESDTSVADKVASRLAAIPAQRSQPVATTEPLATPRSAPIAVRLLGPVEADVDGRAVDVGAVRQRGALAMLALAAPDVVSVDALGAGLWGHERLPSASALRSVLNGLRGALAETAGEASEIVVRRDPGYSLAVSPDHIDVRRFRALRDESRSHAAAGDDDAALRSMAAALDLWRGPALADIRSLPFAESHVAALDDEWLTAREDTFELRLALGDHRDTAPELELLVREHPTRERLWGQLMVALYQSDRPADALNAYARARDRLSSEFGIDAGEALQQLESSILRHDPVSIPRQRNASAAGVLLPRPLGRLPYHDDPIIGRESELDELAHLIVERGIRLLTLTGPGGAGKTRLATSVAERVGDRFPGGLTYLTFIDATTGDAMVDSLATAISGVAQHGGGVEALAGVVGDEPVLAVLDNLELVSDAADSIRRLLDAAPTLTVVTTSRLPLRLRSEYVFAVKPLALPDPGTVDADEVAESPAVQLFVARAQAARHGFAVTPDNARAVADLTRALDGLPLALELAGSRARVLDPVAMLGRLKSSLDLLSTDAADAPVRQRSLTATIAWSYDQLDAGAALVCDRLSVFDGGFTLESAEAVCDGDGVASVLDALTALVDASLIRSIDSQVELRFRQSENVRTFARSRLAEDDATARLTALARWVAGLAMGWRTKLDGPDALAVMGRFEDELANLHGSLAWASSTGQSALAVELVDGLRDFWLASGRLVDGIRIANDVLDDITSAGADAQQRAVVALALGLLANQQTDWPTATAWLEQALAGTPDEKADPPGRWAASRALARCYLGAAKIAAGDSDAGTELVRQAIDEATRHGLYVPQVAGLSALAMAAAIAGDYDAERLHYEDRLRRVREHGDRARTADTLSTLAEIALDESDTDAARANAAEALAIAEGLHPLETRDTLITLARCDVLDRAEADAANRLRGALDLCERTGQSLGTSQCMRVGAAIASALGEPETGARLFGAAHALFPSPSGTDTPIEADLAASMESIREALGAERFASEWAGGATQTAGGAVMLLRATLDRVPAAAQ